MLLKRYNLLFTLTLLTFSFLFSQKEFTVRFELAVSAPDLTYSLDRCNYGLLVPYSRVGKQEVSDYKYSFPPNNVLKTEDGEYYVKWNNVSFADLKKNKIYVTAKVKMFTYDLFTAKKQPKIDKKDMDTIKYLKAEENFRSNSKTIVKVAETISGDSREDIVRKIFNYVLNGMEYCIFNEQDRGAKKALKEGKGDCTEYSELMVTLCRAKKIPARIVKGIIPKSNGLVGHHNWVEVFFPEYGWVAFDPTWADGPKANTTFDRMRNAYIQTSYNRFISNMYCSCSTSQYGFSYRYKDSCVDLGAGIAVKVNRMTLAYNTDQYEEALRLSDTLLIYEPDNVNYWNIKGMTLSRQNKFEEGYSCFVNSLVNCRSNSEKRVAYYALANHYALKDDKENAIKWLKDAVEAGFDNYNYIASDRDLKNLKDHPSFNEIIEQLKAKTAKPQKDKQD